MDSLIQMNNETLHFFLFFVTSETKLISEGSSWTTKFYGLFGVQAPLSQQATFSSNALTLKIKAFAKNQSGLYIIVSVKTDYCLNIFRSAAKMRQISTFLCYFLLNNNLQYNCIIILLIKYHDNWLQYSAHK